MKLIISTIFLVVLSLNGSSGKIGEGHGRRVVCYMASWGVYLAGQGKFDIADAEPAMKMCTHIVYLFVLLDENTLQIKSGNNDRDFNMGGIPKLVALKQKYPHIKTMVCLGGWDDGSTKYSKMVKDAKTRERFIQSVEDFLISNQLDGIDINWQFPGDRGGVPDDKKNLVTLIKEIRESFNKKNLIISVALSSFPWRIDLGVDGKGLADHAHFLNILSYEYHAWWDNKVGSTSPLNCNDNFCLNNTYNRYLAMGVPPYKMNMGLSSYGTTFRLVNPTNEGNVIGQLTSGQGFKGVFNSVDGFMAYNEFCLEKSAGGWNELWDPDSQTFFFSNRDRVVSIDTPRSYEAKVKFAMDLQLGGVIYYGLEKDDFKGNCKDSGGTYPLLRSIHKALSKYSKLLYDDIHNLLKRHNAHFFWNGMKLTN